jgi:hypothetical protein
MRNLIVILLSLVMMTGCVSSEVKDKLSTNAAKLDGYVSRMESGETTPEEDQNLIRVMRIWTWSMNWAANGEEPPADVKLVLEGAE